MNASKVFVIIFLLCATNAVAPAQTPSRIAEPLSIVMRQSYTISLFNDSAKSGGQSGQTPKPIAVSEKRVLDGALTGVAIGTVVGAVSGTVYAVIWLRRQFSNVRDDGFGVTATVGGIFVIPILFLGFTGGALGGAIIGGATGALITVAF